MEIGFKKEAMEVIDRMTAADGVVITRVGVVEDVLKRVYELGFQHGKDRAALYVSEEVGTAHAADEIRKLHSCF